MRVSVVLFSSGGSYQPPDYPIPPHVYHSPRRIQKRDVDFSKPEIENASKTNEMTARSFRQHGDEWQAH
jgi:hypothetical protein